VIEMKTIMLMCVIVLGAVLTRGASAVQFPAPQAQPEQPQGEGWYFREYEINIGSNPDVLLDPGTGDSNVGLLGVSDDQLRNFPPGSLALIGQVATVGVICPQGYVSTGCIGGTVPPSISNVQFSGGADGFGAQLRTNSGFNVFTGCGITARFEYPIPSSYLRQSSSVFVKVEAYCSLPSQPIPPPITDPCSCKNRQYPLGCTTTTACGTGVVCYVGQAGCPGFAASQNSDRVGQFFKCVQPRECQ